MDFTYCLISMALPHRLAVSRNALTGMFLCSSTVDPSGLAKPGSSGVQRTEVFLLGLTPMSCRKLTMFCGSVTRYAVSNHDILNFSLYSTYLPAARAEQSSSLPGRMTSADPSRKVTPAYHLGTIPEGHPNGRPSRNATLILEGFPTSP